LLQYFLPKSSKLSPNIIFQYNFVITKEIQMSSGERTVILITGGNGMIGNAIKEVVERDADHKLQTMNWVFATRADAHLTSYEETKKMFEKYRPTHVIHLAAKVGGFFDNINNNLEFFRQNMIMNDNVLNCAYEKKVKKVVSCSSTCIYPDNCTYPVDEKMIHLGPPHNSNLGYAYAKRMLDVLNQLYSRDHGCIFTSVVPCNVFGPHDNFSVESGHSVPALIHKCYLAKMSKTALIVNGSGKPQRQYIYSLDLAQLILWVLFNYNEVNPINLTTDEKDEITVDELTRCIAEALQFEGPVLFNATKPEGAIKRTTSNAKLRRHLKGFQFTPFKKAIQETVDWFITNYDNARK
ncbi:GDP-L-fucose synthase, partial [Trichinella sp. T6]